MTERAPFLVQKFGGTSVRDAERLRRMAGLVADAQRPSVVVVSALAGTTNRLVELIDADPEDGRVIVAALRKRHEAVAAELGVAYVERVDAALKVLCGLVGEPASPQRNDRIMASGEDLCVGLAAVALEQAGLSVELVDARELIPTNERFGAAVPQRDLLCDRVQGRLRPVLDAGRCAVVQGFVGADTQGRTTTLGRGGSDYSAVLLGAALHAEEVVIWTDVPGMHTADPGAVPDVRIIPEIGFEEAVELAYFGAKVLQPAAAKHAVAERVPLRIRNAADPESGGTVVRHDRRGAQAFAAVAFKPDVVLIEVRGFPTAIEHGFLARVFGVLARHEVAVDLVATSHSSTAFTIDHAEDLTAVREELGEFANVTVSEGMATVTVVGRGLLMRPGMDAQALGAVGETPVHLISQASDVSLSFVVDAAEAPGLIQRLHAVLIAEGGS